MANGLQWALDQQHWMLNSGGMLFGRMKQAFKSGLTMVFRRDGEAHLPDCLRPSFKSRRICIMVWGYFPWNKLGPLLVLPLGGIGGDEYIAQFS